MRIYNMPTKQKPDSSPTELKQRLDHVQRCLRFIRGEDDPVGRHTGDNEDRARTDWLLRHPEYL